MAGAKEGAAGQGRGMRRFQHQVFAAIDEHFLLASEAAPEHKNQAFPLIGQAADDGIREGLPADFLVRPRLIAFYREHGVEQEHALFRPVGQVAVAGDGNAQVFFQFLVDILQRWRDADATGH